MFRYCDESLVEAVSSLIWVTPRLSTNCQELRTVSEQLCLKYGKAFYQQSLSNLSSTVNETLIQKMCPEPPANAVIDRYLEDIAKGIGTDLQVILENVFVFNISFTMVIYAIFCKLIACICIRSTFFSLFSQEQCHLVTLPRSLQPRIHPEVILIRPNLRQFPPPEATYRHYRIFPVYHL